MKKSEEEFVKKSEEEFREILLQCCISCEAANMPESFYQAKTLFSIPLKRAAYILAAAIMFLDIAIIALWGYQIDYRKTTLVPMSNNPQLQSTAFLYFKFYRRADELSNNITRCGVFQDF